ncbi:Peptidase C39 family protein [Vibrio quintilis]|uniref:Peptidase C39 family protein n=2 Tax=Vibrio quintilis TaxID=1117707 RepID=A0A1M7Z2T7_9VIBR|nr:Peptidase C39 family protein [Vibrio quintilis]
MILESKGIEGFTPDKISQLLLDKYQSTGTTTSDLKYAMTEIGLTTRVFQNSSTNTLLRLQRLVDKDNPAIVQLNMGNNYHFVVLDEIVAMPNKELLFKIRDPAKGVHYGLKQSDFESLWQHGDLLVTKPRN